MADSPVIYGLEDFQSRTLVSQAAENEKINFLVGTQSLKNVNQVQLIEFDDDTGVVSKQHFDHSVGEIWGLVSAPQTPNLIATVFYNTQDYHTECGASVWQLPLDVSPPRTQESSGGTSLRKMCDLLDFERTEKEFKVHSLSWAPEDDSQMISLIDNRVVFWDLQEAGRAAKVVGQTTVEGRGSSHLGMVRWCPHQQATQVAATFGSNILSFDLRTMKQAWTIENAHSPISRDLDFNPNKQYYLATCGDDGATKFWDVRNSTKPVLTRTDHSHWVWSVRFNASYDQLVLTCSSDQRVVLSNLSSVASQPIGSMADEEESKTKDSKESGNEDGVLHIYEHHEESVYAVEWSAADFWTFASISFDGRFVINKVVGLNSIEDMDSIIWSQGFCSTYFFLLDDLRPLIEFCDESENRWDYNGRYVVVTRSADDLEKITTTMKGRKTEQILGIIPAQKSDHWILFTNKFYWENGISSLKTTLDKKAEVAYFPDKTSNMNGATIRFITFQWVPNIFLVKDEDGTIVDTYGVEVETVKSVAETMNFKLDLQEPPNGERWGSKISEGNWTGLLGKLFRNEGDIGVANIFISASRGEAVAFSAPFATPRVCFLCGVPPSLPQWQSVFLPFQPELWGAYGVSILVCGILLYFFIRNKREIVNCFLISLQAHIKEPSVFLETRTTVRVFAGVMWLYCIILTTAYSSKLTAFLTITTKPSTYETIKELYEADVPVYGLSPFLKDALTSSVDPTIKNLADHFVVLRESEIFDKVAGAKGAFMQDESYLKYIGQTKLKRKSRLMKECFAWYNVAMVLQRHSPLKKKIDAITKRIVASGMVEKWFEDSIVKAQAREETKSTSEKTLNDDAATDISLTLTHLQGVFFIYIFLSFLAFMIFIVELIVHVI